MSSSFYTHIAVACSCVTFLVSLVLFVKRIQFPYDLDQSTEIDTDYHYLIDTWDSGDDKFSETLNKSINQGYLREKVLGFNRTSPSILQRFIFINPSKAVCTYSDDTEHFMVIVVLSRALNFDYRQAIRTTWGSNGKWPSRRTHVQTVFFVGIDDSVQSAIRAEQAIFNDVIEIGIPENYPFVAHKELAALLWTRLYCPLARIVFRADDDILLDILLLLDHLESRINLDLHDGLYGWFRFNNSVHRVDKWAVTKLEYTPRFYPPYTFGIGYLFSNDSCQRLIDAANHPDHQIIRIGDAYITGILRELAAIPFYEFDNLEFAYTFYDEIPCEKYFQEKPRLLICMSKLHMGSRDDPQEFYDIWDVILARHNMDA